MCAGVFYFAEFSALGLLITLPRSHAAVVQALRHLRLTFLQILIQPGRLPVTGMDNVARAADPTNASCFM